MLNDHLVMRKAFLEIVTRFGDREKMAYEAIRQYDCPGFSAVTLNGKDVIVWDLWSAVPSFIYDHTQQG